MLKCVQNAVFFALQKTKAVQKCCIFALQKQRCVAKMHLKLCTNVMLNILLRKMYAKMHFCIKCIFAASNAFDAKMICVHFPKENVQLCKNAVFFALQKTKMRTFCWCKNAFDAVQKCI